MLYLIDLLNFSNEALFEMNIKKINIGNINLNSGKIVACDPLVNPDRSFFLKNIIPGQYSVNLFYDEKEKTVALSQIIFRKDKIETLEMALLDGQNSNDLAPGSFYGFPVDSGLASFMDYETSIIINKIYNDNFDKNSNWNSYDDFIEPLLQDNDYLIFNPLIQNDNNIAIFNSGYGDGIYPSYFGLNDKNEVVCIVTDFQVIEDFYDKIHDINKRIKSALESKKINKYNFFEILDDFYQNIKEKEYYSYDHQNIISQLYRSYKKLPLEFIDIIDEIEKQFKNKDKQNILLSFYNMLKDIFIEKKDIDNLINIGNRIINIDSKNIENYDFIVDVYKNYNQFEKIIEIYKDFFKNNKYTEEDKIYFSKKIYEIAQDIYEDNPLPAVNILEKSTDIYTGFDNLYFIGEIYSFFLEDNDKALYYLNKAIEKYNDNIYQSYALIASIYEEKNDETQAIDFYLKAIENIPKSMEYSLPFINLSSIYIDKNDIEKALEIVEKGLINSKNEPLLYHNKALILFKNEKKDEAVRFAEISISLYEKDYKENGDWEELDFYNFLEILALVNDEKRLSKWVKKFIKEFKNERDALLEDERYKEYID